MGYFLCGLAGVLVGALVASAIFLYLLQRRADRDLIERRLKAILTYRDCIGDLVTVLEEYRAEDPKVLRQVWKNVASFCREFRLTGWYLAVSDREPLAKMVGDLERELRAYHINGNSVSIPRLREHSVEVERILEKAAKRQLSEYRKFRFLPIARSGKED